MNGIVQLSMGVDACPVQFELLSISSLLQPPLTSSPRDPAPSDCELLAARPEAFPSPGPRATIHETPHHHHPAPDPSNDEASVHSRMDPTCLQDTELLGKGTYAKVWKALYTKPDGSTMTVAVKRLRPEALQNPTDRIHFVAEARLLRKLKHRNVVQLLGMGRLAAQGPAPVGGMFLVQEFVGGGTLKRQVQTQMLLAPKRDYTYRQGLSWMLQVAQGLAYLHTRDPIIIHRDLKLDNILLTSKDPEEAEAKIADLGLHIQVGPWVHRIDSSPEPPPRLPRYFSFLSLHESSNPSRRNPSSPSTRHSHDDTPLPQDQAPPQDNSHPPRPHPASNHQKQPLGQRDGGLYSGVTLSGLQGTDANRGRTDAGRASMEQPRMLSGRTGSLLYMAPEVFQKRQYSHKADIFSYGVMLHEVLHGHLLLVDLPVHQGPSALEAWAERVAGGHRPRIHPRFPPALHSLVSRCWQQDAALRPEAAEVAQLLGSFLASTEVQQLEDYEPSPTCCVIS